MTLVASCDSDDDKSFVGQKKVFQLNSVAFPGISGTATFIENQDKSTTVELKLTGTPDGGMHPAHIHMGSVANAPGSILLTFNPVNGDTGMSKTNVSKLDDQTSFGYSNVLSVYGYVNVHLSAEDLGIIVAQGNVGVN